MSGTSKRKKKKRTLQQPHKNEPVDDKGCPFAQLIDQDQWQCAYRANSIAIVLI
jgi:hypothetical protein